MRAHLKISSALAFCVLLQGCLGSIIGTTADVAIEVIKIPFKVGGAVVDVVTGDDFTQASSKAKTSTSSGDAAKISESRGLQ